MSLLLGLNNSTIINNRINTILRSNDNFNEICSLLDFFNDDDYTSINNKIIKLKIKNNQTKTSYFGDFLCNAFYDKKDDIVKLILINISEVVTDYLKDINEKSQKIIALEKDLKNLKWYRNTYNEIIGEHTSMKAVFNQIKNAAATDASVLITGESGTGKELVAKAIHNNSIKKKNKFVAINCGALPENLIESELFGYEKGAFSGAIKRKIGRFEYADGGTLLLDEIGELPINIQSKLLRVLQDKEVTPLGGNKSKKINVRIIAATNRDLYKMIDERRFREDLFYRINVIPIHIPPLRERKGDIYLLATYFLYKYNLLYNKNIKEMSKRFQDYINENIWKGNIRELENFIERTVIQTKDRILDLIEEIDQNNNKTIPKASINNKKNVNVQDLENRDTDNNKTIFTNYSLKYNIEKLEKELIKKVYKKNEGNAKKAAEELKISLRNYYYKLEKYSIK